MSLWKQSELEPNAGSWTKIAFIISLLLFPPVLLLFMRRNRRITLQGVVVCLYIILFWMFIILRIAADGVLQSAYSEQLVPGFWLLVDKITSLPFRMFGRLFGYITVFLMFVVGALLLIRWEAQKPPERERPQQPSE